MKKIARSLIILYQQTFSRVMPPNCRYIPTCSQYTLEAIERHGFYKGCFMGAKRIMRCHPLHAGGYDPVP